MKRFFSNPDEFARTYPPGYNVLCFAEVQSKEDGVTWQFHHAAVDNEDDNICIAEFDLLDDRDAHLRFRFERRRGQMSDSYEIIIKTYTAQKRSEVETGASEM